MKKIITLLLAICIVLPVAASGGREDTTANQSSENRNQMTTGGQEEKILVVYFSLAGEQYNVGYVEEGNTSIIAHMIAEETDSDLFEITAVTPYPTSHSELLDVSRRENSANARPEYVGDVEDWDKYDTVFIGYPNWWGDMPKIVYSFLESHDFSGKTVIPFCTHGGSGLSRTERTISDITNANMIDGFAIAGTTAQNNRDRARAEVTDWLEEIGYGR